MPIVLPVSPHAAGASCTANQAVSRTANQLRLACEQPPAAGPAVSGVFLPPRLEAPCIILRAFAPPLQVDYTNNTDDGQVSVELTGWVRHQQHATVTQVVPCSMRCIAAKPSCCPLRLLQRHTERRS